LLDQEINAHLQPLVFKASSGQVGRLYKPDP
jgi:hypothetical protein